jgi:cytoskeletal protein CcmA (bactofilin family)
MKFFGTRQDDPAPAAPGVRGTPIPSTAHLKPSILSEGMTVRGDVVTPEGILHLDGTVVGDVQVTTLAVGPAGTVEGNVTAASVTVKGTVRGDISCDELLLAPTARVTGAVRYRTLTVQGGATLAGPVTRREG